MSNSCTNTNVKGLVMIAPKMVTYSISIGRYIQHMLHNTPSVLCNTHWATFHVWENEVITFKVYQLLSNPKSKTN